MKIIEVLKETMHLYRVSKNIGKLKGSSGYSLLSCFILCLKVEFFYN